MSKLSKEQLTPSKNFDIETKQIKKELFGEFSQIQLENLERALNFLVNKAGMLKITIGPEGNEVATVYGRIDRKVILRTSDKDEIMCLKNPETALANLEEILMELEAEK